jgi:peptidyl-prolyl cis-trans isomerase SurA
MTKIKIISILIFLITFNTVSLSKENIFIIYNINNELITNIDLKKEAAYLVALNDQLKNLDKQKIQEIAKESLVRETIKEIEILKYFNLEQKNTLVDGYVKQIYLRLKLNNEKEFNEYLKKVKLTNAFIRKKIKIEITWNQLIYEKFKSQIKIDKKKIFEEVKLKANNTDEKSYQLSEIVFEIKNKSDLIKKKNKIDESIKEIGFKNSATIYSISNSAKFGGDIGWITEKELSKKILNQIGNLEIGQYTKPIRAGSSYLVLRINDLKYEKKIQNTDEEVNQRIKFETDRQLQQFSKIHYNKVKINTNINEL